MESWEEGNRINTAEPAKEEIKIAGKAPGIDNIPPEILKVDLERSVKMLYPLFKNIRRKENCT
jgi:hypothetical protein